MKNKTQYDSYKKRVDKGFLNPYETEETILIFLVQIGLVNL